MNSSNTALEVQSAARVAFEEVLEGKCQNQVQENFRLRFISASAKYLRSIRELEYARSNPQIGNRPVKFSEPIKSDHGPGRVNY